MLRIRIESEKMTLKKKLEEIRRLSFILTGEFFVDEECFELFKKGHKTIIFGNDELSVDDLLMLLKYYTQGFEILRAILKKELRSKK